MGAELLHFVHARTVYCIHVRTLQIAHSNISRMDTGSVGHGSNQTHERVLWTADRVYFLLKMQGGILYYFHVNK